VQSSIGSNNAKKNNAFPCPRHVEENAAKMPDILQEVGSFFVVQSSRQNDNDDSLLNNLSERE
jgi:hypothetical protein